MGSFESAFVVDRDGGLSVTETISYTFDSAAGVRRGIFRNVTVRQGVQDRPDVYRYLALSGVSASSPTGANATVALVDNGAQVQIRLGSSSATVSGTQTYVLRYKLANVVNPFTESQTAELFYNVVKDDSVPKNAVTLSVTGPAPTTEVRCTRGTGADCDTATGGATARFAVTNLAADEDLTIAARYPLSAFGVIAPDIRTGGQTGPGAGMDQGLAKAASLASVAGGLLAPILAFVGMGLLVATRGRDEWYAGLTPGLTPGPLADSEAREAPVRRGRVPTVAVQFNPPPGVQPGLVGTVIDESSDTLDVSATVIDLAVRGFLRIEEVEGSGMFARTDWSLTVLPAPDGETLRPYEETVLRGLFHQGSPVLLSQLKNHFASTLSSAKDQMYDEVLQRRWFRKSPQSQRMAWRGLGFFLMGGGVVTAFAYGSISRGIDGAGGLSLPIPSGWVLGAGLLVAGFIVQALGARMASKTAEGSAVLAQSLGFRQYLVTAEANQIRFEEAQEVFSRFLPYAIVFGVAERWATVFQEVAAAAAAAGQGIVMPSWYIYHGALFPDFGSIANGVDSFSTNAAGTFQSTPGSSGGSGFGSSGGSFSGGGVGGSSSGSW
ncbi:MAG: DUF2207 domain-containing protein [Actinomycetales bacterium]|nr:DUF2207 domain-containing protein [Actinomycetales bacterium]